MKETKFIDTEVGRIPQDWEVSTLGEITCVSSGGTPNTSEASYWGGNIPWMNSGELNLKIVPEVEGRITEEGLQFSSTHWIPKECVLIGLAGQGKTRGTAAFNLISLCTNQSIGAIYPCEAFHSKFVYYFMDSCYEDLRALSDGGGGRGGLTKSLLESYNIALPPKPEQHRIASALTSIDNLLVSLDRLIAKKEAIKQGAMQQLLTGKKRLKGFTEPWVEKKLGDIAETASGGTPSRSNINYYKGDICWFTTSELTDNYLYDSNEHITNEALSCSSTKLFPTGTLLIAMYGATIGRLGILCTEAATNQACCAINCQKIDTMFLFYLLLLNRPNIIELGCGAGQPNISQDIVKNLEFIVPYSLPEQQAIASVLTSMDNELSALEAKRKKYGQIKQGMMQQLLTGKIRLI